MSHVILFQGDSITDGNRTKNPASFWDLNHYLGHGYVQMCAGRLNADYPDLDFQVHNRGLSGNRVSDLFARWEEDTISLKPDTLSIMIGVNDCLYGVGRGATSVSKRYNQMYRFLIEETYEALPNVRIIMLEPFILSAGSVKDNLSNWEQLLKPIQELTAVIAKDYKAVYVPLQEKFNQLATMREPSYWMWDGIHPTPAGHEIITREWIKALLTATSNCCTIS